MFSIALLVACSHNITLLSMVNSARARSFERKNIEFAAFRRFQFRALAGIFQGHTLRAAKKKLQLASGVRAKMSEITINVIKGRVAWQLSVSPEMTFAGLRKQVEEKAGAVDGGLRLLHKGKSFPDTATLLSAKVTTGTRMMALATAKQREADARKEKAIKAKTDNAALDTMGKSPASASSAASSPPIVVRGDPEVPGQTNVVLVKGRDKFRANVELSISVGKLKTIAAGLEGMDAAARDMKLLFKGRFLDNSSLLSECGVKNSSSIVLLFGARHHDAKDARVELNSIELEISTLEKKVHSAIAKGKSRLLDSVDLALAKGEIFELFNRLKDNLHSVQGEEERKRSLEKRIASVEPAIEELRKLV